jgi:protein SCO1/2
MDERSPTADHDARIHRLIWACLGLTLAGVAVVGAWRARSGPPPLPVYGTVPGFTLIERGGTTVRAEDLAGRIWIADFIFTRCGGTCPALTATLASALRRVPDGTIAVSFSVDPERDDPATLQRYATQFGADPAHWLFLTGERATIERVVREGFRLSLAELPPGERERSPEPITHSDRFVLVDRDLRIRGYYHGTDADGVSKLVHDVGTLTSERP